jgi:hypothetical protein
LAVQFLAPVITLSFYLHACHTKKNIRNKG